MDRRVSKAKGSSGKVQEEKNGGMECHRIREHSSGPELSWRHDRVKDPRGLHGQTAWSSYFFRGGEGWKSKY